VTTNSNERLERLLGVVLKWGALTSTTLLAAGLLLQLVGVDPTASSLLTRAGLIILMATPVGRVVVSVWDYAQQRDWTFFALTATVLVILLGSLVVSTR
jgi:uncharacterized membrane protein